MQRRPLLAGLGTGMGTLVAGCSAIPSATASPTHLVQVANSRETSHDVLVELERDGEEREHGPKTVTPSTTWDVEQIESTGTVTVRVYVDDALVWDDTHEIPTPGENRSSYAVVRLEPDGEVRAFVEAED
ncbi:hypothetical protein ACLI4Z_04640 [Natrialbaceae archaeon A-arb3/5]